MKVEIDLNEILTDEYGTTESLAESIHRQVVTHITKGLRERIDTSVDEILKKSIENQLEPMMEGLCREILDAEYSPIDRWGDAQEPTSFRKQMLKTMQEQMVYKINSYGKPENPFSMAVHSVMEEQIKQFQKQFNESIDKNFMTNAVDSVRKALAKSFGIAAN